MLDFGDDREHEVHDDRDERKDEELRRVRGNESVVNGVRKEKRF